jgi:hypothetical protein
MKKFISPLTYLAEDLLREVVKEVYKAGGIPVLNVELNGVAELGAAVRRCGAIELGKPDEKTGHGNL